MLRAAALCRLAPALLCLLLAGCIGVKPWTLTGSEPSDPEPVVADIAPASSAIAPVPAPATAAPREPAVAPAPTPRILVLRSSDADNYLSVSDALLRNLGDDYELRDLNLTPADGGFRRPTLDSSEWTAAIAIGLDAASFAAAELDLPTVFCQIFDCGDLLDAHAGLYGVAAMPPLALQLESWKSMAPEAAALGAIFAENETDLAAAAREAAAAFGIELHTAFARTDRDAIYQFKRFAQNVDGLWLQPNSTILSPTAIQEILDYALDHRVQTIVFNKVLLDWGALVSVGSSTDDIADAVALSLAGIVNGNIPDSDRIRPLSAVDVHVNAEVAAQLGLVDDTDAAQAGLLLTAIDEAT